MTTKVTKWGNSLGIRISQAFAKQIGINESSQVELTLEKDKIIIKKAKYNLDDLISQITPENLHAEIDTGTPLGNEEW